MKKKKIMRRLRISEISAVDDPAQANAKMVIMKRKDPESYSKALFDEALEELQLEDKVNEALSSMWELDSALRRSIREIIEDEEEYPDTMAAIKTTLQQFVAAVSEMVAGALKEIPTIENKETTVTEAEKKALEKANKEAIEKAVKKATGALETTIAKSASIIALSIEDRTHFNTLDEAGQTSWLAKSNDERTAFLKNVADANAIIYTAENGDEFRKSDDPRLARMAKEKDDDAKVAKADREKAADAAFAKRATTELGHLPGDEATKVSILKALETIKDEEVRKAATEMLYASDAGLSKAMERIGSSDVATEGTPQAKLDSLAKAYQAVHPKVTIEKAMGEVLETDEGKALYDQTQARA